MNNLSIFGICLTWVSTNYSFTTTFPPCMFQLCIQCRTSLPLNWKENMMHLPDAARCSNTMKADLFHIFWWFQRTFEWEKILRPPLSPYFQFNATMNTSWNCSDWIGFAWCDFWETQQSKINHAKLQCEMIVVVVSISGNYTLWNYCSCINAIGCVKRQAKEKLNIIHRVAW